MPGETAATVALAAPTWYEIGKDYLVPFLVVAVVAVGGWVKGLQAKQADIERQADRENKQLEDRMRQELDTIKEAAASDRLHTAMNYVSKADMQRLEDKITGGFERQELEAGQPYQQSDEQEGALI